MRLANAKTRAETGLEFVLRSQNIRTPFGKKELTSITPFMPGQEHDLRAELARLQQMVNLVRENPQSVEICHEIFMEIRDVTMSITRSVADTLSVVELFEIKSMLLLMKRLSDTLIAVNQHIPREWMLLDTTRLLDQLDPGKDRINTFYLYDEFSEALAQLRRRKQEIEKEIRKEQKKIKEKIEQEHGLRVTPKFEIIVPRSDDKTQQKIAHIDQLAKKEEDFTSVTFVIKGNESVFAAQQEIENIQEKIEKEELKVREALSRHVAEFADRLLENCVRIGKLDFTLAKAIYAVQWDCIRPDIIDAFEIHIKGGRHLQVEETLQAGGKEYCPVDISLASGVTCITGANMGGKTVCLKLVGLVALMAQYGFFVPCRSADIGLCSQVSILIGDSQSMQRGLSSFGGEMEELRAILDRSTDKSLLLVDEIASGTNPMEGMALTRGLIQYLLEKNYITVATTHFDHAAADPRVVNMQVRGLAGADFARLERELKYANRKERISIISKYMDYRLQPSQENGEIPRDALNIAQMLGIYSEIIDNAKQFLKEDSYEQAKS